MSKLVVYSKKNKASVLKVETLRKKHSQYQFVDISEKEVIANYKKTLNIPGNEIIELDVAKKEVAKKKAPAKVKTAKKKESPKKAKKVDKKTSTKKSAVKKKAKAKKKK